MQRPPSPEGLPPGVFRTSDVDALASLGVAIPEHLATLYVRTVRDLRRAFISNPPHARPQARASRGASATARGERSFMHESKDNPHQDNWLAHAQYASSRTELPSATERAHCDIGVDIDHAIYFLATHAPEDVVRWREQQKKRLDEAVANLRPLSNFMEAYGGARPRHVTRVAGQIPLVVCALLLDATLSPDTELPRAFKLGFTLEGRVRDSGIFRKIDEPTAEEFDEQTAPLRQGAWVAWDLLEAKVRANASSVDPATRAELCTRTREQTMLRRMSPPMRKSDLCRLLWGTDEPPGDAAGNRVCPLASMRFGLWQNDKLRPIEDCKASGVNSCLWLAETISLINFDWPDLACARMWEICQREGLRFPAMASSMDDVSNGYNNCPAHTPQVLCMWDEEEQAPRWHLSYVCGFGNAASVLAFCRTMDMCARVNSRLFAGLGKPYIDDWLQPDLLAAGRSAQDCLSHLMALVGIPLAACMHPSCPECHDTPAPSDGTPLPKCKRKAFRQIQDGLGVTCDLSRAEKGFVDLSPTAGRCEKLIRALREHETSGRITPSECEQLMGKLTFITTAGVFGGIARGASLPFYRRASARLIDGLGDHDSDTTWRWHPRMSTSLNFLEALLLPACLPRRRVFFNSTPPLVAYSDAEGALFGIGLTFLDPMARVNEAQRLPGGVFCATRCPEWILDELRALHSRDDDKGLINCVELVGAISLLLTFEADLYGRCALIYQDNSAAFHAMVSGAARSPPLAQVANVFQCALAGLNMNVWIEHANTKSMVADIPSRMHTAHPHPDTALFRSLVSHERVAVFPTRSEWRDPISLLNKIRSRRLETLSILAARMDSRAVQ